MKITSAKKHIINAYDKKISCMLWGSPGIGKSAIVKQAAKELNLSIIDLRLPQLEPPDVRGIPVPDHKTGKARWFYPDYLPDSGNGILFLDEIDKAAIATKNAALQLVLDREIGSYKLPSGWGIIAAGNQIEDESFSAPLGAALCNRMIHLNIEPDIESWLIWAREYGIVNSIMGYLSFRPEHLYHYNSGDTAFPSPRSWEMLNTMLDDIDNIHEQYELFRAVVGDVVAIEYRAWLGIYKNVKVEDIILKGELPNLTNLEHGKEKSFMYAIAMSVAHYIKNRGSIDGLESNISKFVSSLSPELRVAWSKQIPISKLIILTKHSSFKSINTELINIIMSK